MSKYMTPEEFAASLPHPNSADARPAPKTPRPRRTDAELVREILYYREKTSQLQAEMEWEQSPEGRAALEAKALRAAEYDAGLHEHIRRIGVALAELIALIHEGDAAAEAEREAKLAQFRAEEEARRALEEQAYLQDFSKRVTEAYDAAQDDKN